MALRCWYLIFKLNALTKNQEITKDEIFSIANFRDHFHGIDPNTLLWHVGLGAVFFFHSLNINFIPTL